MKNLFFALAFMLIGTFAFANNNAKEELVEVQQQSIETTEDFLEIECWVRIVDVHGEIHWIQVKCPQE